jgi:SAM-dependent methyltransferase
VALTLNLGCGQKPLVGAVNVDAVAMPGVDVVHDLDVFPWPWPDDSVDEIVASHVFEHVADPIGFMSEVWRILRCRGGVRIDVPHYTSRNAFTDPTHRRYCTEETFDYWVRTSWLWDMGGVAYHRNHPFRHRRPVAFTVGGDMSVEMEKP